MRTCDPWYTTRKLRSLCAILLWDSNLGGRLDEMLKAAADSNLSLKANPFEADQNHNPFVTRHGVGIFEFYAKDPAKARRFAKAMAGLRQSEYSHQLQISDPRTIQ